MALYKLVFKFNFNFTIVIHSAAQNSFDNLPSYTASRHSSDVVHCRRKILCMLWNRM